MSDIFISYAEEDRDAARKIARALEVRGWKVWWDRKIPPGKCYDEVILGALDGAKCVVVLWSKSSVKSDWVKEEVEKGKARKILVPAKIDNESDIPFGFQRIQAADLVGWRESSDTPEFQHFFLAVARLLGVEPIERPELVALNTKGQAAATTSLSRRVIARLATKQPSGKATAGLVLGIVGLLAWLTPLCGLPITIVGLILSLKGMKSTSRGTAVAGLTMCIIGLVLCIINAAIGAYMGATGQHPLFQ